MKIRKGKRTTVTFGELSRGDVFEIFGDIHLKIGTGTIAYNAYNLQKNTLHFYGDQDEVIKLQGEISVW